MKYLNKKTAFGTSLIILIFGAYSVIFPSKFETETRELVELREQGFHVKLDQWQIEAAKNKGKRRNLIGFSALALGGISVVGVLGFSVLNRKN